MTNTIRQKFWLAVNIYHEARGEYHEGMVAVGHVVLNRAEKKKKSAEEVILQSMQFSWHNGNVFPVIKDYESFIRCQVATDDVIAERLNGETLSGSDHYFNPSIVLPSWAKKMTLIKRIGNHDFYRS